MGPRLLHCLIGKLVLSLLCAGLVAGTASGQEQTSTRPHIYITATRFGTGITGASTSVITAEDIARSPGATIYDLLAGEVGLQTQSLYGGVNGSGSTVDMRGFGASALSNVLILIDGRRLNDWDLAGFDLSTIPRDSIARIEIIRGNSGAVLYGDGAVGGVINIVTKSGVGAPSSARLEGTGGSFKYGEATVAVNHSDGPLVMAAYGNVITSGGYRDNNDLRQQSGVSSWRYVGDGGSAFLNLALNNQHLGLPGPRLVTLASSQVDSDPRGTNTPFDYGDKQEVKVTGGVTRILGGMELVIDGGVRRKNQQAAFFSPTGDPFNYVDTGLSTYSLTPRVNVQHSVFGLSAKAIAGIDGYYSTYDSDRPAFKGAPPVHRYALTQGTAALYAQESIALRPDADLSFGARVQNNSITARDTLDPTAPGYFGEPQGVPLNRNETQYAYHVGLEVRPTPFLAVFGRAAHSFRLANIDERIGMAPWGTPTSFDLKTQTSDDVEGGVKIRAGQLNLRTSVYDMRLQNELHFDPINFVNTNLDPTRRYGVETQASYRLTDQVRLKGGLAYTRSVFREGPFAGHDVPLVSRWTGSFGASWNIWDKALVFDGQLRYVGERRMDNDQMNFQPQIPAHTLVDMRLGGEYRNVLWSVSVQNLFDVRYFDYAAASTLIYGTYNAYPMPGRVVMFRLGVKTP